MDISEIHGVLANMTWQYYALISIWGYIRFFRKEGINDSYRGALMIAEGLMLVEVLVGGFIWISGFRPDRTIHLLYGALLPAMIPFVYAQTKGKDGRPEVLMYSTVLLFSAGLIFRASYTG